MQKTIAISIYDGDTEKNILRSEVLSFLKASGHRIVLLIRSEKRLEYYRENFADGNVVVDLLPNASTRAEAIWNHVGWNSIPTYSVYLRRHDMYLIHKKLLRYSIERVLGFLGRARLWRELLRLSYWVIPDDYAADVFAKYQPDVVFAPNMFSAEDCRLLKAARKRGIKTMTTVKSWDVLTTKAFTRVRADKILVFNELNRIEAVQLGDYREDQVIVTGFPQFDVYAQKEAIETREAFCARMGINPAHHILLFAVPGDWKMPFTDEVVKHVDDAIEAGELPQNTTILARVHPKYTCKTEQRKDFRHVVIDRPGTYFGSGQEKSLDTSAAQTFAWTFTDKDILHLANSIYHSDMVLNIESTMTLDGAAFDKPVILIGYDGDHTLPYLESIVRNYDRNHYIYVMDTKGAALAKDKKQLVQAIQRYLDNPKAEECERVELREKLLYRVDGKSSQRVAETVLSSL